MLANCTLYAATSALSVHILCPVAWHYESDGALDAPPRSASITATL